MRDIAAGGHAPGLRAVKFSRDWITRPVFGVALAAVVIGAIFAGAAFIAVLTALVALAAAREWHRMTGRGEALFEVAPTVGILWLMLAACVLAPASPAPYVILAAGAGVAFLLGGIRRTHPLWQAAGVLYLGAPSLALVMLRQDAPHGAWAIVGLFLIVWATDTGALCIGNLIGGARLAPAISPNKTWAGTLGGMGVGAVVAAAFVAALGGRTWPAAIFGAGLSIVAHGGDLFESWVKRRFRRKDSGSLIPGHGGVLDRVDSTLPAVVALAILVFVFGFDPLFGANP